MVCILHGFIEAGTNKEIRKLLLFPIQNQEISMRQLTILLTLLLSLPLLWSALPAQADEVTEDAIMYAPAPDTLV